jgi:hypothetical protein
MRLAMSARSTVASARWQTVRAFWNGSCVQRCITFAWIQVLIPSFRALQMMTRIG